MIKNNGLKIDYSNEDSLFIDNQQDSGFKNLPFK
jgi:hypothetical protein